MIFMMAGEASAQPGTNCSLVMNCPSNIVVTSCFNVQEFYSPTASNICCGVDSTVTCNPPSGSIFAVGTTTTVNCTATDCAQNTNYCSFTVTVVPGTSCATNYLQVQCPTNIVVASCTNIQEFYAPTVTDTACSNWTVVLSPPSGSFFAPNTTTLVDCFVGDYCGETNDCSFTVTVVQPTASYTNTLVPGFNFICNPFNNPNGNTANVLFPNPGNSHLGDQLEFPECGGTNTIYTVDSTFPTGWANANDTIGVPPPTVPPGQGVIYVNESGGPETVVFTGYEDCSPQPSPLCPCGIPSLVGCIYPGPGTYQNITGQPPQAGAEVIIFNGTSFNTNTYTGSAWTLGTPVLNIGQAAYILVPCPTNCLQVECPTNKTVQCGSSWTFDLPQATSCCTSNFVTSTGPPTNILITPISTVTNGGCPQPQFITQTWQITDACGDTTNCSQTVTVQCCQTNCITLVCPTNIVLATCSNCAPAYYTATATNVCCFSNVVVQYSLPSGTCFPIGTNTVQVIAYDPDCASTPPVSCSFTVTVVPGNCSTNQGCCGPDLGPQSIQWLQLPTNSTSLLNNPLGANGGGTWIIASLPGYGNVLITQDSPPNVDMICTNGDFGSPHSSTSFDNVPNADGTFRFTQNVPGLYGPYSWGVIPGELGVAYATQYTTNGADAPLPAFHVHFYFLSGPPNPCSLVFADIGLAKFTTNTLSQPLTFRTEYDLRYQVANYPAGPSAETELDGIYDTPLEGDITGTVISSAYTITGGDDYNTGWAIFQPTNDVALATLPSGSGTDIYSHSYPPTTNLYPCLSVTVNEQIKDEFSLTVGYLCCTNCPTNCLQVQCPEGKTVSCGAPWTFDSPVATSCCTNLFVSPAGVATNILIIPTSTVTNGTCPQFVTQSWLIEDACGDTDTCSQIVMIECCTNCLQVDCATNKTVGCGDAWTFDPPAATTCCSNLIYTLLSSNLVQTTPCQTVYAGVWRVADSCSNSAVCTQLVTVVNSGPPVLTPGIELDYATLPDAGISFAGGGFTFVGNGGGMQFEVDNVFYGAGDSIGFDGYISSSGPFAIGAISISGPVQTAPVTGTGTLHISDGVHQLTGTIQWVDISTIGTSGVLNLNGVVNLTGISYAGTSLDLQSLAASGTASVDLTFQFIPGQTLSQLVASGGFTDFSGSIVGAQVLTTPPLITCPTNKMVSCGAEWTFDPPVPDGGCCTNWTIIVLDTVTSVDSDPCSLDYTRTWQVMDCCSNTAICSQTVTVQGCCTNCCGTNAGPRNIEWLQAPAPNSTALYADPLGLNTNGTWIITNLPCYGRVLVTQTFPDNNSPDITYWFLNPNLQGVPGGYGSFQDVEAGYGPYTWGTYGSVLDFYNGHSDTNITYNLNFYFLDGPPNPCTLYLGVIGLASNTTATVSQPVVFRAEYDLVASAPGGNGNASANTTLNGVWGPSVAGSTGTVVGSAWGDNGVGDPSNTGWAVLQPDSPVPLATLPPGSGTDVNGNSYPPTTNQYPCLTLAVNQEAYDGIGFSVGYVCCPTNCLSVECPTNKTVACGTDWTFDSPVVTTCCTNLMQTTAGTLTNVLIIPSGLVTNGACPQMTITESWLILDGCGDSSACSQTVTVTGCCTNCLQLISGTTAQTGNLFVAGYYGGDIYEFTPGGAQSTFASGLGNPDGLAFNSAGDLFVATVTTVPGAAGYIDEFTPGGAQSTFAATGTSAPDGLAFDSAGNLFEADGLSGLIFEFTPGGVQTTFASGFSDTMGLAFDNAGNLYVSDNSASTITEITPGGTKTIFASVSVPFGLAFDSKGDLFEADIGTGSINEFINTSGVLSSTPVIFASGFSYPTGLAFDGAGNLFAADARNNAIYEFTPGGVRSTFASVPDPTFLTFQPGLTVAGPTNIVVTSCTNIQVFYSLSVTDSCCTNWSVAYHPPSGSYFSPGTTTPVTVSATDSCGNSNSWSFTVTVLPGTNCTNCLYLTCPTNVVVTTCSNCVPVNFFATATDLCCSNVGISYMLNGQSIGTNYCFPVGTSTVQVTASDDCEHTNTCDFTVTVLQNTNMSVIHYAPAVIILCISSNGCALMPDETSQVWLSSGNALWVQGSDATVTQSIPPGTLICTNTTVVFSVNGACAATNVPVPVLLEPCCCNQTDTNLQFLEFPAPSVTPASGTTMTLPGYGQVQVSWTASANEFEIDYSAGNGAATTQPQFTYGDPYGNPYPTGGYSWPADPNLNLYETNAASNYTVTFTFLSGAPDRTKLYLCVAGLYDTSTATVSQPGYLAGEYQSPIPGCVSCGVCCGDVSAITLLNGQTEVADTTGAAGTLLSSAFDPAGIYQGVGDQRNTGFALFQVTTNVAGNALTVTMQQTLGDGLGLSLAYATNSCPPCASNCLSLTCPADIMTTTCTGCAPESYLAAVTDNCCSNVQVSYQLDGAEIGTNYCFPLGVSTVTVLASDDCSNTASCQFTVTVLPCGETNCIDLLCPPDQTLTACSNCAPWSFAASVDDYCCSNVTVSYRLDGAAIGTNYCFPLGVSTVAVQASDTCGNSASCQFTVTVLPLTNPPSLSAPTNVTICQGTGLAGAVIVDSDEWDNSNAGFLQEGQANGNRYATNCAAYLTDNGAHGRNLLIWSDDFSLIQTNLYACLTAAGYHVAYAYAMYPVPPLPPLASLLTNNAVYLSGDDLTPSEITELQAYICDGGGVYIAAGTGGITGGAAGEAAQWNSLVNGFGLNLASTYDGLIANLTVPPLLVTASPVMAGVGTIYNENGNDVNTLAGYPQAQIVAAYGTEGIIGVSSCASASGTGCGLMPDLSGQVTYSGGGFSQSIPPGTIICTNTTVVLTVTNACGQVTNLTIPVILINCASNCLTLTCPTNITISSCTNCAMVNFAATATDLCCSNVQIRYELDGAQIGTNHCFPVGLNTVTVLASDDCSNTASCQFTVAVLPCGETNCIDLTCPPDIDAISCGTNCTMVNFTASAVDYCCSNLDIAYRLNGSLIGTNYCFPRGTNTVQVTATDGCSNVATCDFKVIVTSGNCGPIISVGPTNFVLCTGTNGCATMPDEVHASGPLMYALNNTAVTGGLLPTPMPIGAIGDPHWTLVSAPSVPAASPLEFGTNTQLQAVAVQQWVGPDALSGWIGPANDANDDGPEGNYDYQTTFILPQDGAVTITGEMAADDAVMDVLVNGVSTGISTTNGYAADEFTPFTLNGTGVAGTNTLDFIVHNNPLIGTNPPADNQDTPTGLLVDFTTVTVNTSLFYPAAVQATNCDGTSAPGWQSIPPGTRLCNSTNITFVFTNECGQTISYVASVTVETCCVQPPPGMVLWLTFDETVGDTCLNSAGYNNGLRYNYNVLATSANGPSHNLGEYVGNSLCFDGIANEVEVPNYAAIDLGTKNLTLDAWVKWNGGEDIEDLVDHRVLSGGYYGYVWYLSNGKPAVDLDDGSVISFVSAHSMPTNVWTHLAATVQRGSPNTTVTFYVNGASTEVTNKTGLTGTISNSATLWIGNTPLAGGGQFYGCMDELEIFDLVLSPANIFDIYAAGHTGKCRPTCTVPAVSTVCPNATNLVATVEVCNCGSSTMTFNVRFNELTAAQAGGSPATNGPTLYSDYPASVTLAPNACTNFTVNITLPPGLTYSTVCYYEMVIQDQGGSGQQFASIGKIADISPLYNYDCYPLVNGTTNVIWQTSTNFVFVLNNPTNGQLSLNATAMVLDGNLQLETNLVSLNGLPPGTPVTNQVVLPPLGSQSLSVNVNYLDSQPWHPFYLVLLVNAGGNGAFVPVASSAFAEVISPTVGPPLSTGVTNGQVVVEWDMVNSGWTLRSTTNLGGTNWIPVNLPVMPLPDGSQGVTLPLTNKARFFQLIGPGSP